MALLQAKHKVSSWLNHRCKVPDVEDQRQLYGTLQSGPTERSPLLSGTPPPQYPVTAVTPSDSSEDNTYVGDDDGHAERESKINPRIISDAILGLSDGLTVPFALSAGLSAFGSAKVVVLGSLAELVAGAISMGLGGYVGAKSELESYLSMKRETEKLVRQYPSKAHNILHATLEPFDISAQRIDDISDSLEHSPDKYEEFILSFHHREQAPSANQALTSAITLALGYFIGGFIPLIPYFIVAQVGPAFWWSAGVMAVALFAFGYAKTCIVRGWRTKEDIHEGVKGGLQMLAVGGIAAGSAVGLVHLINSLGDL
ncbi:hypothetical protein KEM52_000722 [Ascosphaera acerosa]|nr:hypothetical protein KEM52_000722 [Ascosphaera acerosa]